MEDTYYIYYAISSENLETMLSQVSDNPEMANRFWDGFSYKIHFSQKNYFLAKQELLFLLKLCKAISPVAYEKCHKGTPFYWLGTAAFLQNDYETATFFFDAAVSEDTRLGAHPIDNPTPAIYFLTLVGEQPSQAAKQLVEETQARVQRLIDSYNLLSDRLVGCPDLNIEYLRNKFLCYGLASTNSGLHTLVTTFISFFVEWDYRNSFFEFRSGTGTAEPFLLHLFKGCVLFESLLRENPKRTPESRTLRQVINELHDLLGISQNPDISGNYSQILIDLLNADDRVETAIIFTGRVRNTTAHKISWNETITQEQYQKLFIMIASSCLHAINCLY